MELKTLKNKDRHICLLKKQRGYRVDKLLEATGITGARSGGGGGFL